MERRAWNWAMADSEDSKMRIVCLSKDSELAGFSKDFRLCSKGDEKSLLLLLLLSRFSHV